MQEIQLGAQQHSPVVGSGGAPFVVLWVLLLWRVVHGVHW